MAHNSKSNSRPTCVLVCSFSSAAEARAAAEFDADRLSLIVPTSFALSPGDAVAVFFSIGGGPQLEVPGTVQLCGPEAVTVLFDGSDARVLLEAIRGSRVAKRNYDRFGCAISIRLRTGAGLEADACVSDVGIGGAHLTELTRRLRVGESVTMHFGDERPPIPGRVQWYREDRGTAGVSFAGDPALLLWIRRIVSSAAAGLEGGARH